jgi:hypothetical protein|tara:strand:- start:7953 stop:8252 length:300 start_codon:yes stop_codon:yes gene_type:complete
MIDTEIVQRCGCGEDDCVEILGLEESIYACFTCGYAGVTPSGADNYEDEIHIGNLEAEVKRLREGIKFALSYTRPTPHTDDPWMACREFIVEYLKELIE